MKFRIRILLFLALTTGVLEAQAQTNPTKVSVKDVAESFNVDYHFFTDTTSLGAMLSKSTKSFKTLSGECYDLSMRVSDMISSLSSEFRVEDSLIWIDSNTVIYDFFNYKQQIEDLSHRATRYGDSFAKKERQRLSEERKKEEEIRAATEREERRKRFQEIQGIKNEVNALNKEIILLCSNPNETDKNKKKELTNLYYSYKSIFNTFNLTQNSITDEYYNQLEDLINFQKLFSDSILGPQSYREQIENFKNELRVIAGPTHQTVLKSYQKFFKPNMPSPRFETMEGFMNYVAQLQGIMSIQQRYLDVITFRNLIAQNEEQFAALCGKKYKNVASSFRDIVATVNTTPAFSTLYDADRMIEDLMEFTEVQEKYVEALHNMDSIQSRSEWILQICNKKTPDVATAYKNLLATTDFVPHFRNLRGAEYYFTMTDEFILMQNQYMEIISVRNSILAKDDSISKARNTSPNIINGYKMMKTEIELTPNFTTSEQGSEFISQLRRFEHAQKGFLLAISNFEKIKENTKVVKATFKSYGNITQAFAILMANYESYTFESLAKFLSHQEETLNMQQFFLDLSGNINLPNYNTLLKKVKDPNQIKKILEL